MLLTGFSLGRAVLAAGRCVCFCLAFLMLFLATTSHFSLAQQGSGAGSVNPYYGSFSTEVPITIPKYHNLEPNLKLVYNSTSANTWIGVGWSLSGMSFIERALPGGGSPKYDSNDSFFMDGIELIECVSQGGTHCTRIQNYARIKRDTINNRWMVWGTNGNLAVYDPIFNTSMGTFRWFLSSVTDPHGNTVNYFYWPDALNDIYLDRIVYNGTTVTFHRELRSDVVYFATGADLLGRTRYRLNAIDVQVNGQRARAYRLQHSITTAGTNEALLIQVQQFGSDATVSPSGYVSGPSFLPPMVMDYQRPFNKLVIPDYNQPILPKYFDGVHTTWHSNAAYTQTADFNGDGFADYIWQPSNGDGRWVIAYGSASGFVLPDYNVPALPATISGGWKTRNPNSAYMRWGDFNGDGKTDYLWIPEGGDGRWLLATATSTGFNLPSYAGPAIAALFDGVYKSYNPTDRYVRTGDFNGDGSVDLMWIPDNGDGRFVIAYGGETGFTLPTYSNPALANTIGGYNNRHGTAHYMRHGDFNGDGKTDYLWIPSNGDGRWLLAFATDQGFIPPSYSNPAMASLFDGVYQSFHGTSHYIQNGDFNGDGRTDQMWIPNNGDGRWVIAYGNGKGFELPDYQWPALPNQIDGFNTFHSNPSYTRLGDFNGDGKTDYMWIPSNGDSRWLAAFGRGINMTIPTYFTPILPAKFDGVYNSFHGTAHYMRGGDFNGDGKDDLMWIPSNGDSRWVMAPAVPLLPNYLDHLENGIGGTTDIVYSPSSAWNNTFLPVGFLLQTVSSLITSDGRGNYSTSDYSYEGGLWSPIEKRFLGFRKVTAVLDAQGNYTETYYLQQEGSTSKPEVTYFRNNQGDIFSYTQYYYEYNAQPPYTSLLTQRWDYECNLGTNCRRSLIQLEYDQYANVIQTREYGDVDVQGDERISVRGYKPNTTDYLVGFPAYEITYEGIWEGGPILSQVLNHYDGNASYESPPTKGDLTKVSKWNDQTGGYITNLMEYDFWGNMVRSFDELGRQSTVTFDPLYHVFPTQAVNALGQSTSRVWNTVLGLETSSTDLNGETISTAYDAIGRKAGVTYADGSTTLVQYWYWGFPSLQHIREIKPDGSPDGLWVKTFQDGLGRVYRTEREGGFIQEIEFQGTTDRVWRESLVHSIAEPARWISYSYDGANRIRIVTHPDGNFTEVVYANDNNGKPYEANFDELGNERTYWRDISGNLLRVREKNGISFYDTTYEYDALGRLIAVTDDLGNISTFTWDSLGRKLASDDADMGYWSYTYDDAGNLLTQTDAKGQVTVYSHDALNRMIEKIDNDRNLTQWFYDEQGHGASIGRLTRVTYPNGSDFHYWDGRGLEVETKRCVAGDCQTLMRDFDGLGRLSQMTYPDGETVDYVYDGLGRLSAVPGYVSAMTWSSSGQLLTLTYANGVTTDYSYDADRLWLGTADVTGPSGVLYNADYAYDAAAHVTSITSTTNAKLNLSFSYDDLGRLLQVSGGQSQSFAYDAVGNMTYNSALGNYTYASAAHPHAVTKAGTVNYTYDANGNMKKRGDMTNTWDAENRLASITKPLQAIDIKPVGTKAIANAVVIGNPVQLTQKTTFDYDSEGNRIRKTPPSGAETKYYQGLVQKNGNNRIQYYYAGPILVAKKIQNGSKFWYHADHLNSIRLVTDSAGAKVKGFDYAAFGEVVDETGRLNEDRGFNGHITDDDCDLVYMRARYYDPELGRFLSADIIVPDPGNPQALNRYTFVYNNPISNSDPTGHAPVVAAVISALITTAAVSSPWLIATAWIGAGLSIAGYYLKDPLLSSIGGVLLGFASGYATYGGWAGGLLGASAAYAASPLSPLDPGLKEAIGWAFSGIGSIGSAGELVEFAIHKASKIAASLGAAWLAEQAGLDSGEFNAALTVVSFAGNLLAGSRYIKATADKAYERIRGFTGRESKWYFSVPFDIVDTVIGYQGLPTASAYEYMFQGNTSLTLYGHSLGSLDVNNLAGLGVAGDSVIAAALPAFNGGGPGVSNAIGNKDLINFFSIGKITSPYADTVKMPSWFAHSAKFYPNLPPNFYTP